VTTSEYLLLIVLEFLQSHTAAIAHRCNRSNHNRHQVLCGTPHYEKFALSIRESFPNVKILARLGRNDL
jgi:hypothetical protein